MHLVGDDQRRPKKGRTFAENAFKRVNNCVLLVQLACFLAVISLATIAGDKTFRSGLWNLNDWELTDSLLAKTRDCQWNFTTSLAGWEAWEQTLSQADLYYRLTFFAGRMQLCIICNLLALVVGAFNKLLFDVNIFEFKLRHLVVRKDLVSAVEMLFIIFSYVTCVEIQDDADILRNYFRYCGISREDSLPFQPPFVGFYIGLSWTLFCHVVSLGFLAYHTLTVPPPIPTTRNDYAQNLSDNVQQLVAEIEHTKPLPYLNSSRNLSSARQQPYGADGRPQ